MKHIRENFKNSSEFDVVVIGEINVDLILRGNVVPEFGQVEKIVDEANLEIGSSAVIFACGAAKLGLNTAFIGVVGNDVYGHFMINEMKKRSINTEGVIIKSSIKTGISIILAKENDRAILTYSGSIPELTMLDINFEIVSRAKHLHIASYFMLDKLKPDLVRVLEKAREYNLSISLDTNYDPNELWDDGIENVLSKIDIFLPNETEILAITKQDNLESAITKSNESVKLVVVKLGKEGSIGKVKAESSIKVPSIATNVVDTVGAGDSFDAGFIYGYLKRLTVFDSMKIGAICGSLSTRKSGGTKGQPDFNEVKEYFNKI